MRGMEKVNKHDVFNVCTGKPTSLLELVSILLQVSNKQVPVMYSAPRIGDPMCSVGDPVNSLKQLQIAAGTQLKKPVKTSSLSAWL